MLCKRTYDKDNQKDKKNSRTKKGNLRKIKVSKYHDR